MPLASSITVSSGAETTIGCSRSMATVVLRGGGFLKGGLVLDRWLLRGCCHLSDGLMLG